MLATTMVNNSSTISSCQRPTMKRKKAMHMLGVSAVIVVVFCTWYQLLSPLVVVVKAFSYSSVAAVSRVSFCYHHHGNSCSTDFTQQQQQQQQQQGKRRVSLFSSVSEEDNTDDNSGNVETDAAGTVFAKNGLETLINGASMPSSAGSSSSQENDNDDENQEEKKIAIGEGISNNNDEGEPEWFHPNDPRAFRRMRQRKEEEQRRRLKREQQILRRKLQREERRRREAEAATVATTTKIQQQQSQQSAFKTSSTKSSSNDDVTTIKIPGEAENIGSMPVESLYTTQRQRRRQQQRNQREQRKQQQQQQTQQQQKQPEQEQQPPPATPVVRTLSGGSNLIFEMARRMLVWEQEDWNANQAAFAAQAIMEEQQQGQQRRQQQQPNADLPSASSSTAAASSSLFSAAAPRWHPIPTGISDVNPQFRTQSPVMNSQGYAGMIWRNVRKRSKPSMWRYALRTFDRMEGQQQQQQQAAIVAAAAVGGGVQRANIHYEGALVACAKLGLWQRALEIFDTVVELQEEREQQKQQHQSSSPSSSSLSQQSPAASTKNVGQKSSSNSISSYTRNKKASPFSYRSAMYPDTQAANFSTKNTQNSSKKSFSSLKRVDSAAAAETGVFVTDNMVLSVIRACVRAAREMGPDQPPLRREPLDAAVELLTTTGRWKQPHEPKQQPTLTTTATLPEAEWRKSKAVRGDSALEARYNLPLVARHLNPLAAAYQAIGLQSTAADLLQQYLSDRTSGPEAEDGLDPFNLNDVNAKDKAAYSLLVKGAVSDGDWVGAIDALRVMTEAGLYPASRHLNAWTEVSERKTKQRTTRSWKKKRDEFWLESVQ